MSIRLMSQAFDRTSLAGSRLLVMVVLCDHANDSGLCWPSVLLIAKKTRLSVRMVQYLLHEFVKQGWLVIERKGGGRSKTTRYIINLPLEIQETVQDNCTLSVPTGLEGLENGENGAIAVARKGAIAVAPEPSRTEKNIEEKKGLTPSASLRAEHILNTPDYRPPGLRDGWVGANDGGS